MADRRIGLVTAVAAFALTTVGVVPASAEFFGCKEPRTTVSYSSRPHYSPAPRARHTTRYTNEFAAQRSRHVTYSTRPAYRSHRTDRWR